VRPAFRCGCRTPPSDVWLLRSRNEIARFAVATKPQFRGRDYFER